MKKKLSPFLIAGMCMNMIGICLSSVFSAADLPHNWIPIPVYVIAIALIITGIYKTRKE